MEKYVKHYLFVFMVISSVHAALSFTTTAVEITDVADGCTNSSWKPENNSCYLHVNSSVDFYEANDSCVGLGAHLVSIGSKEENKFIWEYVRYRPIWIGLYRPTNEFWLWLDGSAPGHFQWAMGLGNNSIKCAFMDSEGDWEHGRRCSSTRSYVCEQNREFPTTTTEPITMSSTSELSNPTPSDAAGNVVPTAKSTRENKDDDMPIIIGCAVGGLAFVGIVIVVAVVLGKRQRKSELGETNDGFGPNPANLDTCAHGGALKAEQIYAKALKKKDRP